MDIVKRLRAKPPKGFVTSPLMIEAANEIEQRRKTSQFHKDSWLAAEAEIERLREALHKIANGYSDEDGMRNIARQALGEKE